MFKLQILEVTNWESFIVIHWKVINVLTAAASSAEELQAVCSSAAECLCSAVHQS